MFPNIPDEYTPSERGVTLGLLPAGEMYRVQKVMGDTTSLRAEVLKFLCHEVQSQTSPCGQVIMELKSSAETVQLNLV